MHQRCHPSQSQRRRLIAWLAAICVTSPSAYAQIPSQPSDLEAPTATQVPAADASTLEAKPELAEPAEPSAGNAPSEMQLNPPINSTLKLRVARRPWLLEKLTNSRPAPSVKMRPPQPPPAEVIPPAMSADTAPAAPPMESRYQRPPSVDSFTRPAPMLRQPGRTDVPTQPPNAQPDPAMRNEREQQRLRMWPPSASQLEPPSIQDIPRNRSPQPIDDGWRPRTAAAAEVTPPPAASAPTQSVPAENPTPAADKVAPKSEMAPKTKVAPERDSPPSAPNAPAPSRQQPQASEQPRALDVDGLKAVPLMREPSTSGNALQPAPSPTPTAPQRRTDPQPLTDPPNLTNPPNLTDPASPHGTTAIDEPQPPAERESADQPQRSDTRPQSQPIDNADRARPEPQGSSRDESVQSEKQPAESESAKPLADPTQKDREIAAGRADASNKLEPSKKVTGPKSVTLRELRIDPHGAPQKEESNRSKPAPSDDDRATINDDDRTPDDGRSATDSRVSETSEDPELAEAPVPSEPEYDYSGFPLEPLTLNRTVRGMQRSMKACLQYYYARPEVADQRSNWGMLHSIMVYGVDTKVIVGRKKYSAIAWIAGNNPCRGQRLLVKGNQGIEALSGVGLQGHQGQMLAVFGLCGVPGDYPLYAGDTKYSVNDVLEAEMKACREDAELTFTLIGLAHYLDTDESWVASDGQRWDFERLIRSELSQPIVGSACGGTHRLMGFAHALRKRRAEGRPINGQWRRAELFLEDFQSYCYRLQNRDGSMSTDWFEGREDNGDLDRKIQTTGHMVEWLLTVTPDSQLQNPRLVSAVRFLLVSMYNQRTRDWAIGPKGHALRSLAMFYERAYRSGPAWQDTQVASGHRSSHR